MIRLLRAGVFAASGDRRRLWLEIGQPLIIGPQLVLTALENIQDGERELVIRIESPTTAFESVVPAGAVVSCNGWASLWVVPRAVEQGASGASRRVFLEFVRTTRSLKWAS
ncbi:hypothetical protein [Candidatus Endoriftia persephonae]|jgi:hypothetical protein|uniref:Uncharacterized protein n=3 Tax=Gammaproteobacteria TaxID=1236 RepID=G2FD64_9GAMM|nr:hypothetical protein [Candidatus Endoriftia persephone]EGW55150.1 hypothetical protein TevJSym_ae00070 [endosymbiont of Tevnia jerichonana (vent Tica)]USF88767.1 hypothetical protein L0Y14_05910 [Candidatus Endoriftia persephone]